MADENEKISELNEKATPVDADLVAVVDTEASPNETKKVTLTNLLSSAKDCDNHVDGSTNGVYTLAERTKLAGILIKVAKGSLTPGVADAYAFNWQNPEASAIVIIELMIDITTEGADLNEVAIHVSTDRLKLDANGGATDYITGQILVQNASSLAGKYYITYLIL